MNRIQAALGILVRGLPGVSSADVRAVPAYLPIENPLETADGHAARTEAALTMMDEDCYGFLLLTVRRDPIGPSGAIQLAQFLQPSWWPAVALTLWRMVQEVVREGA